MITQIKQKPAASTAKSEVSLHVHIPDFLLLTKAYGKAHSFRRQTFSYYSTHLFFTAHCKSHVSRHHLQQFPLSIFKGFWGRWIFFVLLFRIVAFTVFFSLVVFAAFNRLISFSFLIWFCLFLLTFFRLLLNILFFKSDKNGIVSNGSPVY